MRGKRDFYPPLLVYIIYCSLATEMRRLVVLKEDAATHSDSLQARIFMVTFSTQIYSLERVRESEPPPGRRHRAWRQPLTRHSSTIHRNWPHPGQSLTWLPPSTLYGGYFWRKMSRWSWCGCHVAVRKRRVRRGVVTLQGRCDASRWCDDLWWLIPRTAGGRLSAPSGFSQIAKKTAACSAVKFAIAVQPTIWHISKTIDDPMTPKVTPPGHIKWPDLKLRFSKFDIVPKAHQWSELLETRSVQ